MDQIKKKVNFSKVFWVFIVGSVIGCIVETIVCLVQKGHFEVRQGVIYGPFIPIYGLGAVMFYFVVTHIKETKDVFFISMVLGGFVEYISSYVQQACFGTVSWDYSNLWFDINGRTSLLHCIYWGIAGILFVKMVYPFINRLDLTNRKLKYATAILAIFMAFNISISWAAGVRQEERWKKIENTSQVARFLDTYYPDEVMNFIFPNRKIRIEPKER